MQLIMRKVVSECTCTETLKPNLKSRGTTRMIHIDNATHKKWVQLNDHYEWTYICVYVGSRKWSMRSPPGNHETITKPIIMRRVSNSKVSAAEILCIRFLNWFGPSLALLNFSTSFTQFENDTSVHTAWLCMTLPWSSIQLFNVKQTGQLPRADHIFNLVTRRLYCTRA